MADMTDEDDIEAEFDEGPPDEDLDEDVLELDEDQLDLDLEEGLDPGLDHDIDDIDDNDAVVVEHEDEDDKLVVPTRPRARAADEEEEEEEDENDDVEADLDTILKDRLATHEEEDEDEEQDAQVVVTDDGELPQRKEFEFPCPSCFLLVNARTVRRSGSCPQCGDPIEVPAGIS